MRQSDSGDCRGGKPQRRTAIVSLNKFFLSEVELASEARHSFHAS